MLQNITSEKGYFDGFFTRSCLIYRAFVGTAPLTAYSVAKTLGLTSSKNFPDFIQSKNRYLYR